MSTYSPSLRIELITTGDQAGTWGTTTNTNLGTLVESAIAGYVSVSITSANQALLALNGAADEARNQTIALTTTTTANFNVYAPPAEKTYVIYNTSAYTATIYNSTVLGNTTAAGAGVAIPAGKTMTVWSDGTNFRVQNNHMPSLTLGTPLAVSDGGTGASSATGTGSAVLADSPAFAGTPTAATAAFGTNTTQLATTAFVQAALQALHPVGSIYMNATNNANPATYLGFGTWAAFGAGRVPVGFDSGNTLFNAAEKTGGNYDGSLLAHSHSFSGTTTGGGSHTHNMYVHPSLRSSDCCSYVFPYPASAGGVEYGDVITTVGNHTHTFSGTTGSQGTAGTNTNVQPYITVFMWKRTA